MSDSWAAGRCSSRATICWSAPGGRAAVFRARFASGTRSEQGIEQASLFDVGEIDGTVADQSEVFVGADRIGELEGDVVVDKRDVGDEAFNVVEPAADGAVHGRAGFVLVRPDHVFEVGRAGGSGGTRDCLGERPVSGGKGYEVAHVEISQ